MVKEACSVVLQRWEVMDCLRETSKDKRTLVEDLECSRSTVNRATRELESIGVIEYTDGEYGVTPLGESIASRFEEMMETVELWIQLEPFLQWMPEEEFDLDLHLLDGADLVMPEPGDPYAVINRHVGRLETMDYGKFLLPYVGMHATEKAYEQIVNHGAGCEIIVAPEVWNTFQFDPNYSPIMEEMVETGRVNVSIYEGEMPFSLAIIDDLVQIIADEDEEPRALIETDNTEVRSWAEATFEDYKQQADLAIESPETLKMSS